MDGSPDAKPLVECRRHRRRPLANQVELVGVRADEGDDVADRRHGGVDAGTEVLVVAPFDFVAPDLRRMRSCLSTSSAGFVRAA